MKTTILKFTALLFLLSCNKNSDSFNLINSNAEASSIITTATAIPPPTCGYDFDETILTNSGWTKQFFDDFGHYFDHPSLHPPLDVTKWKVWELGDPVYNGELQTWSKDNLEITSGILSIKAIKQGKSCTSGKMESVPTFSPSVYSKIRFYARIKLPKGWGMWPAFWTYNESHTKPWPVQGEIDILEARGNETTSGDYQINYIRGDQSDVITYDEPIAWPTGTDLTSCYHVYMAEWTPTAINYYFDGTKIHTTTTDVSNISNKSHKIMLNLSVGGTFIRGNPYPNPTLPEIIFGPTKTRIMYVDYVKAFVQ